MEKVVVFGTGGFCKKNIDKIYSKNVEVVAFIDNDISKVGSRFENKIVFSPQKINSLNYDKIIIMSTFISEMAQQLIKLNVEEKNIYIYEDYSGEIINNWKVYPSLEYKQNLEDINCKKVILITHELSLTGAPIALKYAAQALQESGYMPIIISPKNGPLIDEFIKQGITVIIAPVLCLKSLKLKTIINISILVIVNTLCLHSVVEELSQEKIKVLWWLHEGKYSYEIFDTIEEKLPKKVEDNISIYGAGEYSKRFWNNTKSNIDAKVLVYGVPDKMEKSNSVKDYNKNKIIFTIVGAINYRKGQDIFIKAIKSIPESYRERIECWFVGRADDIVFKNDLLKLAENIKQIKFISEMTNDKLMEVYRNSSIMVSTSRDDPMPIVLAEGMMMKKACICSNNTGTASLIDNWENGVVFESGNYLELSNIIMHIIDNPKCVEYMGNNARDIYEKTFIYSIFKENLLKEIRNILY